MPEAAFTGRWKLCGRDRKRRLVVVFPHDEPVLKHDGGWLRLPAGTSATDHGYTDNQREYTRRAMRYSHGILLI
jgi:hypothetical protein